MPGRLRIAARSDLLSAMRLKMASRVSFLPTTTSMMDATLACWAMGGGVGVAVSVVAVASGVPLGTGTTSAVGFGDRESRHPRKVPPKTPNAARQVASTLIREGFFQVPNILRGTSDS